MPRLRLAPRMERTDGPLSPADTVKLENVPAKGEMPERFKAFSDRTIYLDGIAEARSQIAVEDYDGATRIVVPPNAFHGRLGREAEFIDLAASTREAGPLPPYRPEWQPLVHHPILAPPNPPVSLYLRDGRRITADAVHPPENRTVFVPSGYPLNTVGRIQVFDAGVGTTRIGTATLVGRRTIVTAAHCMPRNGSPGQWGIRFVPGYSNGVATTGLASWCEAYRVANVHDMSAGVFDVAVVKLYDPIGDALGWMGSRVYLDDWEDEGRWTHVGYPGQITGAALGGEFPTFQHGIPILDDDADGWFLELEHRGDTSDGNSGGPLCGTFADGPYVVGVHSGSGSDTSVAAGGAGMVDMIRAAQNDWT